MNQPSNEAINRRDFVKSASSIAALAGFGFLAGNSARGSLASADLESRLFIMDTWFWDNQLDAARQVEILKRIGVPRGSDCRNQWDAFPNVLKSFDQAGVAMAAVYLRLDLGTEEVPAYVPALFQSLKGHGTLLWVNPASGKFKPSDPAGDAAAVALLRRLDELAKPAGLPISLYHHRGDWLEKAGDAFRVADKTELENVGCTFNLYHWLATEGPENLEAITKTVFSKLNCLNINGAMKDSAALDVRKAILPLGEGDYDVEHCVRTFVKLGYRGPIGLQGYGIGGDVEAKLIQSRNAWRGMCERIAKG
ncbi:MAG: sugar phosphate isomerase/epimerase family protein [bacterium]